MNGIVKAALKLGSFRTLAAPLKNTVGKRLFTRNLWHMSKSLDGGSKIAGAASSVHKPSLACSCGCGIHRIHTKGFYLIFFLLLFKRI